MYSILITLKGRYIWTHSLVVDTGLFFTVNE